MIDEITFKAYEISYVFGNEEREIEFSLGTIKNGFWGENILWFLPLLVKMEQENQVF